MRREITILAAWAVCIIVIKNVIAKCVAKRLIEALISYSNLLNLLLLFVAAFIVSEFIVLYKLRQKVI